MLSLGNILFLLFRPSATEEGKMKMNMEEHSESFHGVRGDCPSLPSAAPIATRPGVHYCVKAKPISQKYLNVHLFFMIFTVN